MGEFILFCVNTCAEYERRGTIFFYLEYSFLSSNFISASDEISVNRDDQKLTNERYFKMFTVIRVASS